MRTITIQLVVLLVLLAVYAGCVWVLWRMWAWLAPVYLTFLPEALQTIGYWPFLGLWVLLTAIARQIFPNRGERRDA
jgi:ABC-type thiamin/hydroxymethylpyrimidine transport system permease subunit